MVSSTNLRVRSQCDLCLTGQRGACNARARSFPTHMSTSCEGIRVALKSCLIRSDCVIRQDHLPSECLREHFEDLPDECKQLRQSLFECKRGMVCPLSLSIIIAFVRLSSPCSSICEIGFVEIQGPKYQTSCRRNRHKSWLESCDCSCLLCTQLSYIHFPPSLAL